MKSKKKNFVEKTINFLLNVLICIFTIILLISIYTSVQTKILGNDYTDFFGYSMFEVETGSMADTIDAGDFIIVKLTKDVKLDDIVTYKLDNEYVTHRIVQVFSGTYITKGDANNAKDEPIDQNQIIGKVVNIWPNFGIIRKTLFNPTVLIALIITLFLFDFAVKKNKADNDKLVKFIDRVIKNFRLFINTMVKKASTLFEKTKKMISSKETTKTTRSIKKVEKSNITSKTENKDLSICEKTLDLNKNKESLVKNEDYYKDEDELDKTSFYRVIPVSANEVDDKFKNVPTKAELEDYYKDEDELDKTSFYRMIPVDASEVDNTLLEIAKNEIKETEQNVKNKAKQDTSEPEKEEKNDADSDESLTNINFDLLKNKKSKNIIDTAMLIKKEELNELINILVEDAKSHDKGTNIKETLINTYIDAKYYNYYGDKDIEYHGKNLVSKIEEAIKADALASELIYSYNSNNAKYSDMINVYANAFILIADLETARDSITDLKVKREFYKKEIKKNFKEWDNKKIEHVVEEIITVQKNYADTLEYLLKRLETNMFNLNFNKLSVKKDMFGLELEHNVTFSKVYSDYIIDKTYTEGIVAEDKMEVLLTLLSAQIIKDMILSNFNRKYILYIPKSLYTKEQKLEKLLRMIDDKYAKDNVIILLTFEDLLGNKQIVKKVRKMGYKFALIFDKETIIKEKDRGNIYIADYIFIDKKDVDVSNILPFIPQELLNNIIYEDIILKVGDFGGE